nr:hypothetical protein [Tanacetum cinerariifolium]
LGADSRGAFDEGKDAGGACGDRRGVHDREAVARAELRRFGPRDTGHSA